MYAQDQSQILCQYPKSDNIHFYTASKQIKREKGELCQYPKSDNIHFYALQTIEKFTGIKCVNTLNRITFISTYIHKMKCLDEEFVSIP